MKVHNLNGTSDNTAGAPYYTWIRFWNANSRYFQPQTCPRCGKELVDAVGAHVQKDAMYDRSWYIVPICRGCNKANTSFDVEAHLLVPVNP